MRADCRLSVGSKDGMQKPMKAIPNYDLYGERPRPVWNETLHVEPISLRSGAYNWTIDPHRHDGLLQMLYLQSGAGSALFDDQTHRVQAPCVIIVPAQIVHGFIWDGPAEGHMITAEQRPLESLARVLSPMLVPRLLKPRVIEMPTWTDAENPLSHMFYSLSEEYHNRAADHITCSMTLLLTLIIQILRYDSEQPAAFQLPSRRSVQITRLREQVDLYFRQHRSLAEYADELDMTVVTMARLCQEQLGMTPMTLINARLILEAKRELAHSGLTVKEIAHELGFNDAAYFSRFFRNHTKLSPSEFRECLRA